MTAKMLPEAGWNPDHAWPESHVRQTDQATDRAELHAVHFGQHEFRATRYPKGIHAFTPEEFLIHILKAVIFGKDCLRCRTPRPDRGEPETD